MLVERAAREHVVARIDQVDVHVTAPAGVIAVLLGEARRVAVLAKHIDAVDLKMQRRGRGPHEASHSAVADGLAFLAARGGLVVIQVGAGNERAVIDFQLVFRGGRSADAYEHEGADAQKFSHERFLTLAAASRRFRQPRRQRQAAHRL